MNHHVIYIYTHTQNHHIIGWRKYLFLNNLVLKALITFLVLDFNFPQFFVTLSILSLQQRFRRQKFFIF